VKQAYKAFHSILDKYLDAAGRARGRAFGIRQRACVHDLVPKSPNSLRIRWFELLREAVHDRSGDERNDLLNEFVTMALFTPGQRYPVPDSIVRELIRRATNDELFDVLDEFVCKWFSRGGAYSCSNGNRRRRLLFNKLPRGLRVSHNLMSLESEVSNGGFHQFFGNSSGRFARETLEDCRLVGALKKASLLKRAMGLIDDYIAATDRVPTDDDDPFTLDPVDSPEAEMDRLEEAYYALEETESVYRLVAAYIRAHPEKCSTPQRRRVVSKRGR